VEAPGWGSGVEPDVRGARKFESLGQRDDAALAAIAETVDFLNAVGQERIEQRVYELARALKFKAQSGGVELITPIAPEFSAGVCVFTVSAEARGRVCHRMYEEFGIAGAPTGGLRLCPHIYNTLEHIDRAVHGIHKTIG
jgi:selenocysteine lyase/cysteine desulfurase